TGFDKEAASKMVCSLISAPSRAFCIPAVVTLSMLPLRMIAIDRPVTCASVISCAILAAAALLGMVVNTKRVLNRAATGCGRPEIRMRQIRLAATLRTVRNAVPSVPLGQIAKEVSRAHWSGPSTYAGQHAYWHL